MSELPGSGGSRPRVHSARLAVVARRVRERVVDGRIELPMLPAVASQLLELSMRVDVNIRELVAAIESDAIIAGRVIAIANSPFYAVRGQATSVRAASLRLGVSYLREVFAQAVAEAHVFRGTDQLVCQREREHACLVACLARKAAELGVGDTESAFLCGLLHDIGRVIVRRILRAELDTQVDEDTRALLTDMLHTTVGEQVALLWRMPEAVVATVRAHHGLELEPALKANANLVHAVGVSDKLAHFMVARRDVDYHGISAERHWQIAVDDLDLSGRRCQEFVCHAERLRDSLGRDQRSP